MMNNIKDLCSKAIVVSADGVLTEPGLLSVCSRYIGMLHCYRCALVIFIAKYPLYIIGKTPLLLSAIPALYRYTLGHLFMHTFILYRHTLVVSAHSCHIGMLQIGILPPYIIGIIPLLLSTYFRHALSVFSSLFLKLENIVL